MELPCEFDVECTVPRACHVLAKGQSMKYSRELGIVLVIRENYSRNGRIGMSCTDPNLDQFIAGCRLGTIL